MGGGLGWNGASLEPNSPASAKAHSSADGCHSSTFNAQRPNPRWTSVGTGGRSSTYAAGPLASAAAAVSGAAAATAAAAAAAAAAATVAVAVPVPVGAAGGAAGGGAVSVPVPPSAGTVLAVGF